MKKKTRSHVCTWLRVWWVTSDGESSYGFTVYKTEASIIKNKVAPARRTAQFPLYFDWGINDEISLMDYLSEMEEIKKDGAWRKWSVNGEDHKWQGYAAFIELMRKPEIKAYVMSFVEKNMVKTFDKRPEDVKIDVESYLEIEQLSQDIKERKK